MNESDHARSGCELVSSLVWTRSQDCWSSVLCLAPDHASSGKAVKLNSVQTAASFQAFFGLFLECHVMIMLLMLARVKGVSGPARFLNVNTQSLDSR